MSKPITLGAGDHVKVAVQEGVPQVVNFVAPKNKPGRGQWTFSGGTFDAPLDAYVSLQLDDGPVSLWKPANGARVTMTPISGGPHVMTVTCNQDLAALGFVVDIGVQP